MRSTPIKKSFPQASLELQNTKQFKYESVAAYTQRVETCVRRLINVLMLENRDNQLAVGQLELIKKMGLTTFINGVLPKYGMILRSKDPANIQQASRFAQSEELAIKFIKMSVFQKSPNTHQPNPRFNQPQRIFAIDKFCRYCKRKGHLIEECLISVLQVETNKH